MKHANQPKSVPTTSLDITLMSEDLSRPSVETDGYQHRACQHLTTYTPARMSRVHHDDSKRAWCISLCALNFASIFILGSSRL